MESFSALLAICAGNSQSPVEFPTQRPVTRSFDVFFDLRPNKQLSKQWWDWWFGTQSCPLWRHSNAVNSNRSNSLEPYYSGQTWRFFCPCDFEIWRTTLKNSRAPVLFHFKLSVSFRSHPWIQTGVTFRKYPNWGKICFDICNLELWPLIWTFCMDITSVNGIYSWRFYYDTTTGTLIKSVTDK